MTAEAETMIEVLRLRAEREPGRRAYTFLQDGEVEAGHCTYRELDERARAIAATLRATGAEGDRVLLLFPAGLEFIAAFFGCLYAGRVAVPAYPPRSARMLPRLRSIANDCRPAIALTTAQALPRLQAWFAADPEIEPFPWLATDEIEAERAEAWRDSELGGEHLAFLQYTSGSTSTPKGVKVTHGNLLHNQRLIQEACGHGADSVFVTWLPLYHDLGLIGNVLQSAYVGAHCVVMSPVVFLQRPWRWLEAISRYRATTSGAPNFAYDLCAGKAVGADVSTLDLRSWRIAFNGAEPVRAETLARFAAAFAGCGFSPRALYPCYGLAEATLMVSGGDRGEPPVVGRFLAGELAQGRAVEALPGGVESGPARSLVGCGRPLGGQRVLGVDPVSRVALAPGRVGEIWISGPSVAVGYWGRAEESQEAFGACLATGEGPFLRTGDLGFFWAGELYVTGRIKDLIILRGRNVYPQDVELTAQRSHPALRPDAAAAFSPEAEGEERLVLVLEVERSARVRETEIEEIAVAVRRAVAEEHEVQVYDVVLVGVGRVPRTTSGKIQRRACRALYQGGALEVLGHSRLEESQPEPPEAFTEPWTDGPAGIEGWLRRTFAASAGIDPEAIDPSLPLVALGLDSLVAAELANAVETRCGVALSLSLLLEGVSLSELARQVGERAVSSRVPVGPRRLPGPEAGEHPLSWGQRSLWFLNRLAPESAAYNLAGAARLPGGVDPEALRRALQILVDRHAVLRTTYADGKAGPVQRVAEREAVTFVHEEAAGWSEEAVARRVRQAAFGPFDLERGPVFRAALFARGQGDVLVLAVHHIAADFASLAVLVRELGEAYSREAVPGGPGGGLPPVELRYSDFVAWEERRLAGPEAERLLVYWSEKLAGAPPLDLPADRPRPAQWSGRGAARAARLPASLRERLQDLARRQEGTLFMVLLAGFQALLGRRAGQEDFLVGVPASGRGSERLGEVVGYLVNPVAVRADLAGDPTVGEWLDRVRRTVLGALAHQDLPFAFLAERLRLERDPSRPELFQALLAWQQPPGPALSGLSGFALAEAGARLELGRLELESVALESPAAQLDLLLTAAERNGDLGLSLQFSSDLFDGATVERLLGHLGRLLEGLTGDPGRRIAELPLLSAEERWQLLGQDPGTLAPADRGLHELFEEQAARTPEAVALVAERQRLSYRELERRSRALALRLRREGVGPEVRVAVCAGRSEHLVTALLAVLRAGGAYVPLDPAYPAERLAYLLADSAAPVLLTGSRQLASLPAYGGRIVLLDEPEPERDTASRLERGWCHPEQLAYLIYTSGSTGRPKGVAVRHASAVARVAWAAASYPAEQLAGVLAATSVCFDLSVFELFVPLSTGGTVILAEDVLALPELPAAGEVTLVNTVPSAMAELVRAGGVPSSVRAVNLAGEPLRRELVTRLYGLPGLAEVHNLYGPSEDTTYSTGACIPRQEDGWEPAIGRPLPGTRVYLLDRSLELVPPGVPGELWIGGAGLARGYFGRPELTAERFCPDPLGERSGDRLYRTGDLVRRRPDGELEFLGRLDHQVKVRGFRVELGELEAALASHPAVAEATAVAVGEGAERRLVAYLELRSSPLAEEELADFLRRRLPGFMIPSRFVTLAALPRMPNGKVDRKRLPASGREVRDSAGEAPRTATEQRLAELWAELLDVERIGRDDDFFALGGHSLLATRLVFRLRQALGVELPLRTVLEHTTLAALAAALDDALRAPSPPAARPLDRSPAGSAPFLSFPQRRLWLLDRLAPGTSAYNMPLAIRVRGPFEPRLFAAAWNEVVRRHEVLRTAFPEVDGEPVPIVAAPPAGPLPVVDLSVLHPSRRAAEALRRATEAALSPFDLTRGPVLRAALLRLGAEEWVLVAALHHIAGDAWSVEVLVRELAALYTAFGAGRPSPLPEPEIRYADFALWQRDQLAGGAMASQLDWWRERLRDLPLPLDLPAARPRGNSGPRRGGRWSVRLPVALSLDLRQLGRNRGATPFMVLLAGFAALSARYTGATDVYVGTPVAGRSGAETEGLIGVFLNTLALRLDLSGDPAFGDLLTRVREETLAVLAHQDVPFERLLEELRPERDLDRSPLFQVLFNQVDLAENGGLDLPGVVVEALELPPLEPKLDLTVYAAERAEGIELQLHYDASLFEPVQMERMGDHLRSLLEAVAGEPGLRLSELPLERAAARPELAGERFEGSLGERFAAVARSHAERPAVVTEERTWSYGELERASEQGARSLLASLGAGPGRVGLLFAQGASRIAGVLAALRAGKTYVPLDPDDPPLRLARVLEDAGAQALLCDREGLGQARSLAGDRPILELGESGEGWRGALPPVPSGLPAYLLYTSGSTGEPKGVVQSHRNVLHHAETYAEALELGVQDRLSLLASYSFDAAVMDLFGALLRGAALCPFDVKRAGTAGLPEWIERRGITVYHSTPTLYRQLLAECGARRFDSVRAVVLGGEKSVRRDFEEFCRHFDPECRFVNGLGPTESTLGLQWLATAAAELRRESVPVGFAVARTEVRLLTEVGEQRALYGVGEIALCSPYVALGYWNRPELTAAAFVPDERAAGGRLYRTGDLGRWLPDGSLESVGRRDAQLKIRGQRVEPGEVESQLNALPGVREAVVVAWEEAGEPFLAAYLLAPCPETEALRRALRERLPEAMVPSVFVEVEGWPLTRTGKVDRRALPAPERVSGEGWVAPCGPVEEILASLWAEVLGVERVGAHDDFFALGGHSLRAAQLVSRVRRSLGVELALRTVFEELTVAGLASKVEEALRGGQVGRPPLERLPRPLPEGLPEAGALSFAQERLWFLDRLQPGSGAYNMPAALRLTGPLDLPALAAGFAEVVRRHEVLRTAFAEISGVPVPAVAPPRPPLLPLVDLGGLSGGLRDGEAARIVREEVGLPFDLACGPLLRLRALRLGEHEHLVLLTLHHIAADGWSLAVFAREVAALYSAFSRGEASPLPELPLQYADFAAWQRRWLTGEALERDLAWWRQRLAGAPELLELPADRPRPAAPSGRGRGRSFVLPGTLAADLGAAAHRQGSTLFMLLLAAFQAWLHRLTGEEDLCVGTPVAGRTEVETEGLIGLFANTLVLRGHPAGPLPLRELVARARETVLAAHAHQDLPFERLVEELRPERALGRSPLFQVLLVLQNTPDGPVRIPGLDLEFLALPAGGAKLDLSLTLREVPEGLSGRIEYAADLFDDVTVGRWQEQLTNLLASLGGRLDEPVSSFPLLGEGERHQLLVEWNDTAAANGRDSLCLHTLVVEQGERTPDAVAVISESGDLTYRDLLERSRRLAALLAAAGIGPGSFVPLAMGSSPELVVGMLAVMRAGAAFVPLDPEWPEARRREVLDELADLSAGIVLTEDGPEPPRGNRTGVGEAGPESPIYAIYTSGSTGRPKGVVVPHRGIINRFLWMDRRFGAAAERVLQTTRPVYDSFVWQAFWPLTRGGRTVLTPSRWGLDPDALAGAIERHGVTMADFVPSVFNLLVDRMVKGDEPLERLATLRAVVVGGEEMDLGAARAFRRLFPQVLAVNLYGPTEASIGCICHPVGEERRERVPIGRPIDNVAALVLDPAGNPAPVGVPGELCLAGRCVGSGYLKDPEKTGRAFVPSPLGPIGGTGPGRMYRTGDRARWLPDGSLEFLGRLDHQVKIRGLRVELGEVEAALRQDPRVTRAAVLALGDRPGDRRLVACVVCDRSSSCSAQDLRQSLLGLLPAPLVPSSFVFLEALPLGSGGKVDRKALARLAAPPEAARSATVDAPGDRFGSPQEEILAGIWTEVLHPSAPIGPGDDFFALGGHSLLATRVTSRVRRAFGVELPLRTLFEEPVLAGLARRIAVIAAGLAVEERLPLPPAPVPRSSDLPLSFSQQRLWFLESLEPGSALYNLPLTVRMEGPLDAGLLEQSLAAVVRRHESLRTTFPVRDGQPVQAIAPPGRVPLPVVDQEGLPAAVQEVEAARWITAEARRPFDLARGPLLRCLLLRRNEAEHLLLINVHHTVCDGWSIGLLESELATFYESFSLREPAALPELPLQYADYAVWQRERLSGPALTFELGFWRERLEGIPPVLDLPADRPRPAVQTFCGAHLPAALPGSLAEGLSAFSRSRGSTLFMTLLTGLDALLCRYSGEERLAVGTPVANRGAVEVEALIGNFANTLVVPVSLAGNPGFDGLLERVREATLAALAHQDLPFELLVEALEPQRDLSYNPIFQVLFGLHRLPPRRHRFGEVGLVAVPLESGTARFDLALDLLAAPEGIRGAFEYSTDLFDRTTVERLGGHWQILLAGALAAPDRPLSELPLLAAEERQQLLRDWNALPAEPPSGPSLQALVEAWAERQPEAEAVSCGDGLLTYGELDRKANALAHRLRGLGVGPEVPVGLYVERSLEMMVGLLGILKAGGAFLPLDPAYPSQRIARILESARPPVVIVGPGLASELPETPATKIVLASPLPEALAAPPAGVTAANLAYVIYTSGSTGEPKGVQVSHGAAVHLMDIARRRFGFGPGDVWTVFHSFAFDFSVWEIWGALALGGKLVVVPLDVARSPERLAELLRAEGVTVLNQTPSAARALAEATETEPGAGTAIPPFPALRFLVCGGEALPRELAPRLLAWGVPVWNFYGPTEATVWASAGRMAERGGSEGTIPLGQSLPGYRLYVVDPSWQLLPAGVAGELCIAGSGLARGYFRDPALTASRFVPDPFGSEPGGRLYRTGDLVRRQPDGELLYLARIDQQVKVRGFRIELGEVEAALAAHPQVAQAVALALAEGEGRRLVACVVPSDAGASREALVSSLRPFLAERLPDYMVPSAFVFLKALPLSPNGKVNRRALALAVPEPPAGQWEAPRTAVEEILAGLWGETLGVERVGRRDDFFALGGHSLLATRIVSRIRRSLGVELPLRVLFAAPVLADLAAAVEARRGEPADAVRPIARVASGAGPFPLSFSQQRLWFLHQLAPSSSAYNVPAAFRLTGPFDVPAFAASLVELVRRHESLRTIFSAGDGEPVQWIEPVPRLPLSTIDLRALPAADREAEWLRWARHEARRPFDLARGPLLRVVLLRLGEGEHGLLFTLHHIAGDGWSMEVLIREINALFSAFAAGRPSPLPEPAIQYADFTLWQQGWLREQATSQLSWWRERFRDLPPPLDLPAARPRGGAGNRRGARCLVWLPAALSLGLRQLCRREGATLFMALLAGLQALAARYTGETDLCVGIPVAGRDRLETEGLIGIFLNTLAIRTDLSGDPTFSALLERVREESLAALAHQDLPFERLLDELRPERDLDRSPLFQILFNMLRFGAEDAVPDLPGVSVERLALPPLEPKLDLTVYAAERADGIELQLHYDASLFEAVQMERMGGHLRSLLEAVAGEPGLRLSELPLERAAALPALPEEIFESSLGERFVAVARSHAERPAVVTEERTWSYGELERASEQGARSLLASLGAGPGRVGLLFAQGASRIVGVLAALRAGKTYVPLDPDDPPLRLARVLEDAGAQALLCDREGLGQARWLAGDRPVLELGEGGEGWRGALPSVPPGLPAYLLYTSGSTGEPKGVVQSHRNVLYHAETYAEALELGVRDRLSLLASYSFDAAVMDLFGALLCGAALCPFDVKRAGTAGLPEWIERRGITVYHSTPTLYRQLLAECGERRFDSVRAVVLGGEKSVRRDFEEFCRHFGPECRFVNGLGPTESTLGLQWLATAAAELRRESVPVGFAVARTEVRLLTEVGEQRALYGVGEIALCSPYVALGYWNRPELTAAAFVPDERAAGGRLYRTGDLGRWLPDGSLESVGRRDAQLKIRGQRVEPGEVESQLNALPGVREAVVVAWEESGEPFLAAYLLAPCPETEALRRGLRERLPEAMVPSVFVEVERWPLTRTGKVDRRVLPAPERVSGKGWVAPRGPVEEILASLWAEVLGVERVGVHDDFFALGGHSLRATRLLFQVRSALGVELGLRSLFEAPTVAGMAAQVARQRDLREPGEEASLPVLRIAPEERHLPFPLTPIQQAYWVGRSGVLELGNVASHRYLEIEGQGLDLDRFEWAWQRLIERHGMLRAVFLPDGTQQILPEVPPYRIETEDLRELPAAQAEERLVASRDRMSHQVLAIDRWPLFEIRAFHLPGGRVRVAISFDYLIVDAWSNHLLSRELLDLYGGAAPAPPLELSFRDYVVAEQELRETGLYRRSREYWQGRLADLPPGPELPLVASLASLDRQVFVRRRAYLAAEPWRRLGSRALRCGVTPSALLLTVFGEILGTWSKSPLFTLVLTLFNRLPLHPEVNQILGDFTSTTLLALEQRPEEPFGRRARRVQEQLWLDLDHRALSGVEVLRELARVQGGAARAALPVVFTSTLDLHSAERAGSAAGPSPVEVVYSISQTPQVILDHQVGERDGEVFVNWDAVEELFPPGMLDDMFAAYRELLQELVDNPEAWDRPLRARVPDGQLAVRAAVNATAAPVPPGLLHEPFLEQARREPERLAVLAPGRRLTYGELDRRSAHLGRRLRQLGARPNELVAVVMDKGWEQVVAVLAILRSGAAYLPIDPSLPQERIDYLLRHVDARLALTQPGLAGSLAWPERVEVLPVEPGEPEAAAAEPLEAVQKSGDLAYVIFTSGSTGLPKGVMIDHRGALNTVADVNRRFRVGPRDRVLALSALNFDLSVWDVFGLLAAGGAVVFPEAAAAREPARWRELVEREGVTVWNTVPALMAMLVGSLEGTGAALPPSLRLVLMSGDWIPVDLPGRIRRLSADVEVVSLGGATEASIWSILHPIGEIEPGWKSIPYGRPMDNQSFHVLDDSLGPRPDWVPGQLFIGGIGLAHGYWRDEAKTAASFLVHPLSGERLYRTGDLGRCLPDGTIEFLGREDFQVKVQGYRIELGEIEAALLQHPSVRAAVVAVLGGRQEEKTLVAYFVPAEGGEVDAGGLRHFLRTKLPAYMVPATFLTLPAIPLTANGKIDRRALPVPGAGPSVRREYVAPRTPVEEELAGIFAEVLRIQQMGIHDHFFEAGGNSLTAVLLISRVRQAFDVELPLARLFENPTVAEIALAILEEQGSRVQNLEMETMLSELEGLSDEEVRSLLASGLE